MAEKQGDKAMANSAANGGGRHGSGWRIAAWAAVVLILLLPAVAMQFTDAVNWGAGDFVLAAVLLIGTGLVYEVVARMATSIAYRIAAGIALAAALLLVWVNLAVGIIGGEDEIANLMYFGVLAIGITGAIVARFRPQGMARVLLATALAQALVAVIALVARLGYPSSGPLEIVALNGFFVALFSASALFFQKAARGEAKQGAL